MDRAKIVDFYIAKLDEPNFEISSIRPELEKNDFEEEEIRTIVKLVDNEAQRRLFTKASNSKSKELIWVGAFLTIFGAIITIGSYTGLIDMGNSYLIAYGPFFGGLATLFVGLSKNKEEGPIQRNKR